MDTLHPGVMELKYIGSSANKYLVSFMALVGYAYTDDIHNNDRALMFFSIRKVEENDKAAEDQKTFIDYIKLTSDEIADEIDAIANPTKADVF